MVRDNPRSPAPPVSAEFPPVPDDVVEAVLTARGGEREDLLLATDHLAAIVPRLAPEELFFTLSELSQENVPTVLAHARTEQLEFLIDLDLWKKDRVRSDRALPWLRLLRRCGDVALTRWLGELELADLTLLLGQLVRVQVASEDTDPLQDTPGPAPFTLDSVYYVSAGDDADPLVRHLLTLLFTADPDHYFKLMEALVRDVNSELEEHCFEARQRRLGVRGIPEWEEAMEVYARLDVDTLGQLPVRETVSPEGELELPPRYPLALASNTNSFLARCLAALPAGAERMPLQTELAYLTHKVTVADALDLSRLDSFETAVRKVADYVSIGLEVLCGSDPGRGAAALQRHWLQHLFRVGWTRLRRVRTRTRRVFEQGWPQGHKERLLFLDEPLPRIMEGLLRRHPRWYAADEAGYRRFRTLAEVQAADWAVGKVEFLGQFLLNVVDLRLGDLRQAMVRLDTENLKGSTVFLTSLVNSALGREFRFAPVPKTVVSDGLGPIWETVHPPRRVRPELGDVAVEWARSLRPMSDQEEAYLTEFIADCFALLEEEFGHLAEEEVPDPRFTRGLWIE